jgi:hypothetical protein
LVAIAAGAAVPIVVAGIDHPQQIQRLERPGKAADAILLLVGHADHFVQSGEDGVLGSDIGVALTPEVAAEGRAPSVERTAQHFGHESRIGRVEVVAFPAQNCEQRDEAVLDAPTGPESDQHPGRRGVDAHRGRIILEFLQPGIVQVGRVECITSAAEQGGGERGGGEGLGG